MSQVEYQASLARRNDLLRTATERRRAIEVAAISRRARVTDPVGTRIMGRVRRVLSPANTRPAIG
jgi:hypothetical protein